MLRRFFLFYLILFLCACVQKQDTLVFKLPVFPETKQITVTPFPDDFLIGGSFLMENMGDYIVIGSYLDNSYLHIFEKGKLTYLKSFASLGQGPGEFNSPPMIRLNESKSVLYAMNRYGGITEYFIYDVESILQDNRGFPREVFFELFCDEGEQYPGTVADFLAWKDKLLFVRSRMYRFEVQDTLGNTLSLYNTYPAIRSTDTLAFQRTYQRSSIALKPDMSKFVLASGIGCIMEIFTVDASGKIEKEIEKRFIPPIFKVTRSGLIEHISGKTISGISRLSVTDEFIYAGYNGEIWIPEVSGGFPKTIAVFDWSGNPIRQYILDWTFYDFIIDAQRNRCYLVGKDANYEVLLGYFEL